MKPLAITQHTLVTALGHGRGAAGELVGLGGGIGALAHIAGELFDGAGGLLQVAGGLLGALAQVGVAAGDLRRAGGDAVAAVAHRADDPHQALVHGLQGGQQAAGLVQADIGMEGLTGDQAGQIIDQDRHVPGLADPLDHGREIGHGLADI